MPEASNAVAVHLVAASDDNYAMPLAAMVRSVLDNLAPGYHLHVHVVDGGITEENKARLRASWSDQPATVHWRDASGLLPDVMVSGYMSAAAYLRLLIPELLPAEIDRAIYLDSDLIVLGNIGELWDMPFDGSPLLAVQDCAAPTVSSPMGLLLHEELGHAPDEKYLNSGVMVMNLALWRERGIAAEVFRYLEKHREAVQCFDQDGINAVLAGQWKALDPRWNQMSQLFGYPSWRESPFDEETYRRTRNSPLIVHYSSRRKPWHPDYVNRNRKYYYRYLDHTAWRGWRPKWVPEATWRGKLVARVQGALRKLRKKR
ncbi:MAG: glycosyltransferase family 8 protein [Candidatus Hydrogenedentes bacterium]|nr:glycosyltransferase family 8 protein [Candidatus Hydrogenedentota bacterium]